MAKKRTAKSKSSSTKPLSPAQIAARLTWQLKGDLKNAQIAFLRVGIKLARIRDEKLYAALEHADMIHYAAKELRLSEKTLYRYLQVHDWVLKNHPEWLKPRPKGTIPDLSDLVDLIRIEKDLANKRLSSDKRDALVALQKKAEKGELLKGELEKVRQANRRNTQGAVDSIVRTLRATRRRMLKVRNIEPAWITQIDTLIGMMVNQKPLDVAGLETLGRWLDRATAAVLS
jgi:hypothetical protein